MIFTFAYVAPIVTTKECQRRIQDLKLGVAQMDWKIWKRGGGGYYAG